MGRADSEIRIHPMELHNTVREAILAGCTVITTEKGLNIIDPSDISDITWGFKSEVIRQWAIQLNWTNKRIVHDLHYGFRDHSDDTPPISMESPHQAKAQ